MTDRDVNGLVARGLQRYRAGDIDGALTAWEHALALDPDEPRALGYVDYVRQNYASLVGPGRAPGGGEREPRTGAPSPTPERSAELPRANRTTERVDGGWADDESAATKAGRKRPHLSSLPGVSANSNGLPLPSPSPSSPAVERGGGDDPGRAELAADPLTVGGTYRRSRPITIVPDESGESTFEFGARGDFSHPEATSEPTLDHTGRDRRASDPGRSGAMRRDTDELRGGRGGSLDELLIESLPRTVTQGLAGELPPGPPGEDDQAKIEIEDLVLPPPRSGAVQHVDDDADTGDPVTPSVDRGELGAALSAAIDRGAPPGERPEDRVRRRISSLLERAKAASRDGQHQLAVVALDLAMSEGPGLAAAQKLVYRSRDEILDCYHRFFGDLGQRPAVVASYAELTQSALDPRAAFLLSRIDGAISFDEILDVSGMGRLEACRHLALLLSRGIIRVAPSGYANGS